MPAPVSAHALLLRTDPAAGVVGPADQPPAHVSLWFSEAVDVDFNAVVVIDSGGKRVDQFDAHIAGNDPRQITVTLGGLSQGAYVVRWRVTSADNHVVAGAFWFGVGFATTLPREALVDTSAPTLNPLESVARWAVLAAILVLAGGQLFELLIGRASVPGLPRADLGRVWLVAGGVLLCGNLLWAAAQAEAVAQLPLPQALDPRVLSSVLLNSRFGALWWIRVVLGVAPTVSLCARKSAWASAQAEAVAQLPLPQALDPRVLSSVLLNSRFGALWWIRVVLGVALTVSLCARKSAWVSSAPGLLLIIAMSLSGHASSGRELGPLATAMDSLHLAAAAVWLGGQIGRASRGGRE